MGNEFILKGIEDTEMTASEVLMFASGFLAAKEETPSKKTKAILQKAEKILKDF